VLATSAGGGLNYLLDLVGSQQGQNRAQEFRQHRHCSAARRRGETLLAALGGVQVALLTDDQARANAALTALVAAADGAGGADDAALQGLLDEIQLRATVELARREQDPDVATV